jgi:hypothetical protein
MLRTSQGKPQGETQRRRRDLSLCVSLSVNKEGKSTLMRMSENAFPPVSALSTTSGMLRHPSGSFDKLRMNRRGFSNLTVL